MLLKEHSAALSPKKIAGSVLAQLILSDRYCDGLTLLHDAGFFVPPTTG
jgi:hypothetical protein